MSDETLEQEMSRRAQYILKTRGEKLEHHHDYWKCNLGRVVIFRLDLGLDVMLDGGTVYSKLVGVNRPPIQEADKPQIEECLEILRPLMILDDMANA